MRGTQAEGVAATVKHFVLNSQETNRNTQASEVDERTLHEVYYPPFAAAVEAGVASVMGPYSDRNPNRAAALRRRRARRREARQGR